VMSETFQSLVREVAAQAPPSYSVNEEWHQTSVSVTVQVLQCSNKTKWQLSEGQYGPQKQLCTYF
jgi:hypothetical protein